MNAALFDHRDIALMLLEAGADPLAEDAAGNSPRSLSAQQENAGMGELLDRARPLPSGR